MNPITTLIQDLKIEVARSILYYLNRYLKLAPTKKSYEKDMFEDDERSAPSRTVKLGTQKVIKYIEKSEGIPASRFKKERFHYWVDLVAEADEKLDPEASDDQKARATAVITDMQLPLVSTHEIAPKAGVSSTSKRGKKRL